MNRGLLHLGSLALTLCVLLQPARALGAVDLVLSNLDIQVNGTTVTYDATVCNNGSTGAGTFQLAIYHDLVTAPTCSSTASQTTTVSSLASGMCAMHTFTWTNAPKGSYSGWARADAGCAVAESNENNNNAHQNYKVRLPDLVLSNLEAQVSGTDVTYNVTVCNAGDPLAAPFSVKLYHDLTAAPDCTTPHSQVSTVNGLDSGLCVMRSFVRVGAPTGVHTAWALTDGDCAVAEMNESNNVDSEKYSVGLPDLVLTNLYIQVSGTSVAYQVTVCNNGDDVTSATVVKLYYDLTGPPTCSTTHSQQATVNSLASGMCTVLNFSRTGAPAGSYTAWALADGGCAVTEMNENNNWRKEAYAVGLPDLVASNFHVTVATNTVTYHATVCNIGDDIGTAFVVELYHDLLSTPTCSTTHSQQTTVSSLASGMCVTRTWTQTNVAPGSYTAYILADGGCAVAEVSETNNWASDGYLVTYSPPDAGPPDSLVVDGGPPADVVVTDLPSPDSVVVNPDAALPDSALPDAALPDAAASDAPSVPDLAITDQTFPADAPLADVMATLETGAPDLPSVDAGWDAASSDAALADQSLDQKDPNPIDGAVDGGVSDTTTLADGAGADGGVSTSEAGATGDALMGDASTATSGCDCNITASRPELLLPLLLLGLCLLARRRR